jgi:outer membrane protein assembly factor BamA
VGSNARLRAELSGGPMGGDQVFQKYELDVAKYLRPVHLGGWRPIFMVRSRLGAVGGAFRDDPLIPTEVEPVPELAGAIWDTLGLGVNTGIPVPVPAYRLRFPPESNELFRLGGTTYNPLRGYDDFEIVPTDNINRRFLVTETTDSTGTKTYAVSPSTVYYPGGLYMFAATGEWQFTIADPLHGLLFYEVGGTWNDLGNFRWNTLHRGAGVGIRMEVPLLGLIGFDYGYGFDRLDRATGRYDKGGWEPHIQFGRLF